MKLSFSFAKKAEPKRVVEALATKKDDGRVMITGVEAGQLEVDGPQEAARKLTIPCKNPLEDKAAKPASHPALAAKPKVTLLDESQGGIVKPQLSAEDEEALRELKKDLAVNGDIEARPQVAPILARDGSKKAREGDAPDASKDMFDKVPVESFGEALLRGMGYDPAKHTTKPVFNSKQRDHCLGLGAKALLPSEKNQPPLSKKAGAAAVAAKTSKVDDLAPEVLAPAAETRPDRAEEPLAKQRRTDDAEKPGSASKSSVAPADDLWPSRGLLVRVQSEEKSLRQFRGAQAVVLELDTSTRSCRIKSRIGEKSQTLDGVAVSSLEPLIGPDCTVVRLVRGPNKNVEAKLLHRSERRGVARIRVNGSESEVPLSDVCEFIAPRK